MFATTIVWAVWLPWRVMISESILRLCATRTAKQIVVWCEKRKKQSTTKAIWAANGAMNINNLLNNNSALACSLANLLLSWESVLWNGVKGARFCVLFFGFLVWLESAGCVYVIDQQPMDVPSWLWYGWRVIGNFGSSCIGQRRQSNSNSSSLWVCASCQHNIIFRMYKIGKCQRCLCCRKPARGHVERIVFQMRVVVWFL